MAADFDEAMNQWQVRTDRGDTIRCRYLLAAVGGLSVPKAPEIEGIEAFKGRWVQTGARPKEQVDVTGKRVAVIGTGSSGIQCIPLLAQDAAQLTVFQRASTALGLTATAGSILHPPPFQQRDQNRAGEKLS